MRMQWGGVLTFVAVLSCPGQRLCAGVGHGNGAGQLRRGAARRDRRGGSDALIEKVRTAVTDGSGQYRIIDLPSGTYR